MTDPEYWFTAGMLVASVILNYFLWRALVNQRLDDIQRHERYATRLGEGSRALAVARVQRARAARRCAQARDELARIRAVVNGEEE